MSSPDPARRLLLGAAALALVPALVPVLGGCGFQLRQPPSFSFRRIVLAGFSIRSPMEKALRDELARSVDVMPDPAKADVVLTALDDVNTRVVAASTAAGQVRELRLTLRLRFNLSRPSGVVLLEPTEIEQVRDLSYSETFALAKEQEEAELVRDMRADIVSQVLRALAAPNVSSGT
jgi:LPS-assembly lipoprotein